MSETTTRDTIARIMKENGVTAEEPAETEQDAAPEAEVEGAAAADEAADASNAAAEEAAPEPKPAAKPGERPRGPDGKFAPVAAAAAKPGVDAVQPNVSAAQQQPAAEALKAPADWRPAAKEEFAKLPRVVQEEAIRLHVETKKTLQDAAVHRQTAEGWQRTLAPYEHMFRAAGRTPQEGVGWLVQSYAALQTAPMQQRAQIVAGLVRDFIGTDDASIKLLGSALEGTPGAPAAPATMRPDQVAELVRQQLEQERTQTARTAETQAIRDFEASEPEFLPQLTNEIAALVTLARRQGKPVTAEILKDAHQKALRMNPETAAILKQRDDAAAAKANAAEAAKKKAAASGIKNEPAGPSAPGKASNTRDEVKRQFEKQRGGAHV